MVNQLQELISKLWNERRLEMILMAIALIIPFFSTGIYLTSFPTQAQGEEIEFKSTQPKLEPANTGTKLYVDISGAVLEPDLYELPAGARLKDVIKKAGGLSLEADLAFFQRNFNLARLLNDQDKIYVPTVDEISNGLFDETKQKVEFLEPNEVKSESTDSDGIKINVNSASVEELDALPGVGKTTAEKIIDNRPYESLDDLVSKRAVGKATFEKMKDLLEI